MALDSARAKSLFLAASDLADPAERAAFLDRECDDLNLRAHVEALLRANDASPLSDDASPLSDLASAVTGAFSSNLPPDASTAEQPGSVIAGKYTLAEPIGEGGMGTVWRAKQTEPVKRFVAVKLIKAGMDSKSVLARFEAERQALALMDHPNIARVLDGGLHEGRPFFVMELVKGVPITDFCDANRFTPQQRLALFIQACQAIQHAHQKGIIHRDIKPSNVLVALYDDRSVVKVIDFGVAKATGGTLTEKTLDTGFGGIIGTPQYMSPEQATFNNLDIDTRSDVYALGVLLYELLTGTPPFTRKELEKQGLLEMLRFVREEEPPRPSTRLSTSDALPSISATRGTEPRKLTGLLRNELDWIVMKALEKDRTRRYETANGFATDVQRYLSGEPVQAHPPSTAYRLRKFVRKHHLQVIAVSLVLLALVSGVVGTTLGLLEAKRQTEIARREAEAKEQARAEEARQRVVAEANEKLAGERLVQVESEKKRADEETQIAQAVKDFLQYKLLAQADMTTQANDLLEAGKLAAEAKANPTVRELLARAALELAPDKIKANFPGQPLVQAELLRTIGLTYDAIGDRPAAIDFLTRSLTQYRRYRGPDHPDTLITRVSLGAGYLHAGRLDRALPHLEETLQLLNARLSPDHYGILACLKYLALGYLAYGKPDRALPLYQEVLGRTKAKFGHDHIKTLACMHNLAVCYRKFGKADQALPIFEEVFKLVKVKLGPDHPETLTCMMSLGVCYWALGRLDHSVPLFKEVVSRMERKFGRDDPNTLGALSNLGVNYKDAGKLDRAVPLLEEAVQGRKTKLGPDHPDTFHSMNSLASCYWSLKQLDRSVPLFEQLLPLQEKKLGREHPDTLLTVFNLGVNYKDTGRLSEAIPLLEEVYEASRKRPFIRFQGGQLVEAYARAGKLVEARKLIHSLLAEVRKSQPRDSPHLANQLAVFSPILLEANDFTEAEPLLRECLAFREKTQPNVWSTFNAQSMLGGALLGQKKYADAEPLLLKGYEGMKAREKTIPPPALVRLSEALDRLIDLYTATNKPDALKKYQQLRASYPTERERLPMPKKQK